MRNTNSIARMKELIRTLNEADRAYYGQDDPVMSDREYDELTLELQTLEACTGIIFANSPTKRVGGGSKPGLAKVRHTKPMLSARKTKSREDVFRFAGGREVLLSWKLDGLTLVLRYENGEFRQALTRGDSGLDGEDVTKAAAFIRNLPKKIPNEGSFEVRGEGVVSWADFRFLSRGDSSGHPRNTAAGLVRAAAPDTGSLAHMDFYAFELVTPAGACATKREELDLMALSGFDTVEYVSVPADCAQPELERLLGSFDPEKYPYPADGIIAEYSDLAYGKSLGATAHHENRMLALKWADDEMETAFRGAELAVTRTGLVSIVAKFDPVNIGGSTVSRADLHSLSNFEKYRFGIGDRITVYKANMIIPQVEENLTKSGTYALPDRCPCCGAALEIRTSANGVRNLYCPNPECIARNARKIARFCDRDAMNMEGFTAAVIEDLMAYGLVKNYADLYRLGENRQKMLTIPGFGTGRTDNLISAVENSRRCRLSQFLVAAGIPLMGAAAAKSIDEYYQGSWEDFENAAKEGFSFFHIEGVSNALSRSIIQWYADEAEAKLWRPVLKEITFTGFSESAGRAGNPLHGAKVVITGTVQGYSRKEFTEILNLLGAAVSDSVSGNTDYLIMGEAPGMKKLSAAMEHGVKILTEKQFRALLAEGTAE